MSLKIDRQRLKDVLISFYTLTGTPLVIFDDEWREVMAYPEEVCFGHAESNPVPVAKCSESSEQKYFAPLRSGNRIIGYVAFGRIAGKQKFLPPPSDPQQIVAVSKLLEICMDYILMKDMAKTNDNAIVKKTKEYIAAHLSEQIEILDLCRHTGVSRTKLYETFSENCGTGLAAYIKNARLEKARSLLKSTELSIAETAESVGFEDYNYFSRVFKKAYGISPRNYRT